MKDHNIVSLIGRLTADPELSYTQGGTAVTSFSLAVQCDKKNKEWTSFFDCSAFGKTAEVIAEYSKKGNRLCIDGVLEQQRWEKDGAKRSKVVVFVNSVQFLTEKKQQSPTDDSKIPFDDTEPF